MVYTQCFMLGTVFFLLLFFVCFCLFFWLSGPRYYTGPEGGVITQNSRLGLLLCYLFLAFRADEVTEAGTHHHLFPKAPEPGSDLGSLQDPASWLFPRGGGPLC